MCALASAAWATTTCPGESDQAYQFSGQGLYAQAIEITPNPHAFFWPPTEAEADTALLWLHVNSIDSQPLEVTLDAGLVKVTQTLPSGTKGRRGFNASALLKARPGQSVSVVVRHGQLVPAQAELQTFRNRLPLHGRILVVAPHPDDAEIAAFGLYAGRNSTVVTVTAGNAGEMNYCANVPDPEAHYRMKGELRVIDSVTVPWQGHVDVWHAFNLGYFDGRLQTMWEQPNTPVAEVFAANDDVLPYRALNQGRLLPVGSRKATWKNLVADLRAALRKVQPDIVVTADPRTDFHSDHQLTTVALAQALTGTNLAPRILLYTNHADRNRYPLGPAGQDLPPPPWCGTAPLGASSFYAHPLRAEQQTAKLMALESMHDLRLAPAAQFPEVIKTDRFCQQQSTPLGDDNYLRRAVRPYELFLVVNRKQLLALSKAAAPR